MEVARVELARERAEPGVDEHEPARRLDQQRREASLELALGVEVGPDERALQRVVVAPEDEPRRDRAPAVDEDVAARAPFGIERSRSSAHGTGDPRPRRAARGPPPRAPRVAPLLRQELEVEVVRGARSVSRGSFIEPRALRNSPVPPVTASVESRLSKNAPSTMIGAAAGDAGQPPALPRAAVRTDPDAVALVVPDLLRVRRVEDRVVPRQKSRPGSPQTGLCRSPSRDRAARPREMLSAGSPRSGDPRTRW